MGPSEPPTKPPSQPTTPLIELKKKTANVNNTAKTLHVFPPISPVPERKNSNEPLKRACSVITPHKAAQSKGSNFEITVFIHFTISVNTFEPQPKPQSTAN